MRTEISQESRNAGGNGSLKHFNNEELLSYVRQVSCDKEAADLLKQRWESFWDHDYKTLQKQRFDIDRLTRKQTEQRQKDHKLAQEMEELESLLEEYEGGRKIKALRAQNRAANKRVAALTKECKQLKDQLKGRKVTNLAEEPADDLKHEIWRLQNKLAHVSSSLVQTRQQFYEYLVRGRPVPKGRDAIQVVPPVEVYDHPKIPLKATTIAREVRLAAAVL